MKRRITWSASMWRLRTGAFGLYVEAPRRLFAAALRPLRSARRGGRARVLAIGGALAVGLPASLWMAGFATSTGVVSRTGLVEGRDVAEVTSLEGPLARYYRQRETGGWERKAGREVALSVVVTGYTSREAETDDTPFITAANTRTRPGVIALSRDLLKPYTPGAPFRFGDVIHITGLGDFIVEDAMAGRWERRADIWFESLEAARSFGRRTVVITGPYGLAEGQTLRHPTFLASADGGASP